MIKKHENYKELVLRLAKTDFKLRYHGSALGYVWAVLKPLLMFSILNFVFSSLFNFRNSGTPLYPLELLTSLLLFNFFSEGTMSGMSSLLSKAQLVTKIYIPRWTIVLSSTINALFVFGMNLIVLVLFFFIYHVVPTFSGVLMFFIYAIFLYILIIAFSFLTAPLYVRFRDLSMIWEVLLTVLLYSAPIIYPLSMMPLNIQQIILWNPLAYVIHFAKDGLISNNYALGGHTLVVFAGILALAFASFLIFRKAEKRIAEII